MRESVSFFDDLHQRVDIGLRHQGYLFVARSQEGARAQEELVAAQRGWGLDDVELLDGVSARRRFPYLADDIVNARFRQGDGWLEPRRLALELARASGARFETGRMVTGFVRQGNRIRGVLTADGSVAATFGKSKVMLAWLAVGAERGWTVSGTSRPNPPAGRMRPT